MDINTVVFCGIERGHPKPTTAHVIQHALGLKANYVFDISNACFGFLDGLRITSTYITSGLIKQALIVTGEVSSALLWEFTHQLKKGMSLEDTRLRIGALTVGDTGGAMLPVSYDQLLNSATVPKVSRIAGCFAGLG